MALNWMSVSANMLIIFSSSVKCFSFSGVLKISLNRTLKIYELLQPIQAAAQRMLEKIAFGLGDSEDNEKLLKQKTKPPKNKPSLNCVVEWTTGPGYGNNFTRKPSHHLSLLVCIVQQKMDEYFLCVGGEQEL